MRLSSLKLSFTVSAVAHIICLGVLFAVGAILRPREIYPEKPPAALTLIVGLDDPAVPLRVAPEIVPAPPVQPRQTPVPQPAKKMALIEAAPKPTPPESASLSRTGRVVTAPPARTATAPDLTPAPPINLAVGATVPMAISERDDSSINSGKSATRDKNHPGLPTRPGYLKTPEPLYPLLARRRHQQGLVILSLTVSASGRPARVRLKETSGFPTLDEAAVKAVKDWEFDPARIGAIRVESEIEVPVRFTLAN
jgi:protein TonB